MQGLSQDGEELEVLLSQGAAYLLSPPNSSKVGGIQERPRCGQGAQGGQRLPERGAPRGLSNLRMVKHKGQSQVRQPMRRLLQSGMGSTGPSATPTHSEELRASELCPQPFTNTRVDLTTAVGGNGEGPGWVPAPRGKGRKADSKSHPFLRRSCWKLPRSVKQLLLRAACCSRARRLRVLNTPNEEPSLTPSSCEAGGGSASR